MKRSVSVCLLAQGLPPIPAVAVSELLADLLTGRQAPRRYFLGRKPEEPKADGVPDGERESRIERGCQPADRMLGGRGAMDQSAVAWPTRNKPRIAAANLSGNAARNRSGNRRVKGTVRKMLVAGLSCSKAPASVAPAEERTSNLLSCTGRPRPSS